MSEVVSRDLHPLEKALLEWLSENSLSTDIQSLEGTGMDQGSYRRAVQWLLSRDLAEVTESTSTVTVELGAVGEENLEAGTTPELALLEMVDNGTSSLQDIQKNELFDRGRWGSAMGALLKEGLLTKEAGNLVRAEGTGGIFREMWTEVYLPLQKK